MARKGGNKKACEKYKMRGALAVNKKAKAERHKKLMERFAKRREEGKAYEYSPNPCKKGTRGYRNEARKRACKNIGHDLPLQKMTSIFRKLDNELAEKAAAERAAKADKVARKAKTA